jgi:hypothetical protein
MAAMSVGRRRLLLQVAAAIAQPRWSLAALTVSHTHSISLSLDLSISLSI